MRPDAAKARNASLTGVREALNRRATSSSSMTLPDAKTPEVMSSASPTRITSAKVAEEFVAVIAEAAVSCFLAGRVFIIASLTDSNHKPQVGQFTKLCRNLSYFAAERCRLDTRIKSTVTRGILYADRAGSRVKEGAV